VGDLDLRGVDAFLGQHLDLARPGLRRRPRVGHDRGARAQRRARGRAVDLLDVVVDPGLVGRDLDEPRARLGPLDALLDVVHEQVGHEVGVARLEVDRQVVVGVDARAGDDLQTGLLRQPDQERDVAAEHHRGRLDDSADAVRLNGAGHLDRLGVLGLLVVQVRPLEHGRLVATAEVLVDQGLAQISGVDGTGDGLHLRHSWLLTLGSRDLRA
jgi:hypothetical protein